MSLSEKISSDNEIEEFFSSLNEENEEKVINSLKNSTIKIWTYINKDGLTPLHQSISLNLYELSKEIIFQQKIIYHKKILILLLIRKQIKDKRLYIMQVL